MIALWTFLLLGGLIAASLASRRAVGHALTVAEGSRVSPGFIGMTVMAIGTDLPEIANSIIAAATGHGDLNVGDGAGSAATQVTLVLGILCFVATVASDRRTVATLGVLTVAALGTLALLIRDGEFGRLDGVLLVGAWLVSLAVMKVFSGEEPATPSPGGDIGRAISWTALWLVVVAVAATVVVQSFVAITESLGLPEIMAGAVVLALGTSLPELIVDWTAVRRGAGALALGDLFGSTFLDATLAIGIGPAISPTAVSSAAAVTCVIAAVGILAATGLAVSKTSLDRTVGIPLLAVYAATTIALISTTG